MSLTEQLNKEEPQDKAVDYRVDAMPSKGQWWREACVEINYPFPSFISDEYAKDILPVKKRIQLDHSFRHRLSHDDSIRYHALRRFKCYKKKISDEEEAFEWDEPRCVFREALLNRGELEIQKKECFKRYCRYIRWIEERKHLLLMINHDLAFVLSHLTYLSEKSEAVAEMVDRVTKSYEEDVSVNQLCPVVIEQQMDLCD
jgi:hypothetical protein